MVSVSVSVSASLFILKFSHVQEQKVTCPTSRTNSSFQLSDENWWHIGQYKLDGDAHTEVVWNIRIDVLNQ